MEHSSSRVIHDSQPATNRVEPLNPSRSITALTGRRFHFIGIGGVGMSALAQVLLRNHARVSGSDRHESEVIERLRKRSATVYVGHDAAHIPDDVDTVVMSAAVSQDNPELQRARLRGVRILKYAEMLGQLFNHYQGIAISGTHGKSTTSGWLSVLLKQAGVDTNFIVGARCTQLGSSSGVGGSPWFVAEACEYDRSFLNLWPYIGCILNIERDHLDYYTDEAEIIAAFAAFAGQVRPEGVVVAYGDDPKVRLALDQTENQARQVLFGLDPGNTVRAERLALVNGLYHFDLIREGHMLGRTSISLPGRHNVINALAVATIALEVGLMPEVVLDQLAHFTGVERRTMLKGVFKQITVLDDYAHHPTEVKATLEAIRQRYHPKRLWCVFQPHQYSRTRFLLDDFVESFKLADVTIVPEIYGVRDSDESRRAVNAQVLVQRLCQAGSDARFVDGVDAICEVLEGNVAPGDVVVTMGAGDIWKVADEYIQRVGVHC